MASQKKPINQFEEHSVSTKGPHSSSRISLGWGKLMYAHIAERGLNKIVILNGISKPAVKEKW